MATSVALNTADCGFTRGLIATRNVVHNPGAAVTTQAGIAVRGTSGAGHQLVGGNLVQMKATQGTGHALVAPDGSWTIIMAGGSPQPVNSGNFPRVTVGTNSLSTS